VGGGGGDFAILLNSGFVVISYHRLSPPIRKVFIKGLVRTFELGGENRIILSTVKNWRPGKFFNTVDKYKVVNISVIFFVKN
jgi:hypothetical protein